MTTPTQQASTGPWPPSRKPVDDIDAKLTLGASDAVATVTVDVNTAGGVGPLDVVRIGGAMLAAAETLLLRDGALSRIVIEATSS